MPRAQIDIDELPTTPPGQGREDFDCTILLDAPDDPGVPDHVALCECDNHTGRCQACNSAITIGPSGTEYGHRRGYVGRSGPDEDCPHRPAECNPTRFDHHTPTTASHDSQHS